MILSLNLHAMMKRLVLGKSWVAKRMKEVRFAFINLPGRIVERSRELIIRLTKGQGAVLLAARERIQALAVLPAG